MNVHANVRQGAVDHVPAIDAVSQSTHSSVEGLVDEEHAAEGVRESPVMNGMEVCTPGSSHRYTPRPFTWFQFVG
jgi:hypothetical protein